MNWPHISQGAVFNCSGSSISQNVQHMDKVLQNALQPCCAQGERFVNGECSPVQISGTVHDFRMTASNGADVPSQIPIIQDSKQNQNTCHNSCPSHVSDPVNRMRC